MQIPPPLISHTSYLFIYPFIMLQVKYPSLLNANNFITLAAYESKFVELERAVPITPQNLTLLVGNLLGDQSDKVPSPLFDSSSYSSPLQKYLTIASYCKLIVLSPQLSSFELSLQDVFQIWELRINLLLMASNQRLPHSSSLIPPIPNAQFLRNETNLFLKELVRLDDKKAAEGLPKELSWHFKLLIHRIKYGPSLVLVNQLYNDLFQLRSETPKDTHIENKARIMFYNICAIMITRNELLTTFNLLTQTLAQDLHTPHSASLTAIVGCVLAFKETGSVSPDSLYFEEIATAYQKADRQLFDRIDKLTASPENEHPTASLDGLVGLVVANKITPRMLCTLIAELELEQLPPTENTPYGHCLDLAHQQWPSNVYSLYALE
ncbi:hypothetical protein OGAPHI_006542 [Ogataea philodendri]|uniref:Uncharacterized protein n=1 Tax=Ogataea philodendri TaxID=1378263 RepID=A0A9P8NYS5_9ASCO|nr:uncharacterized protein OGAPHI_006542 [Ogataea philodendri]KAH3661692.1 hypothetical protein OGAPHI_006542 [Ogataea philodendri]